VVFALSRPGPQREASRTQTPASRDQPPQLRSALVLAVKTSPPYPSERRRTPLRLRWWMVSLKPKLLIIGRRRRKKTLSARILCSFLSSPARSLRRDSFSGAAHLGMIHSRAQLDLSPTWHPAKRIGGWGMTFPLLSARRLPGAEGFRRCFIWSWSSPQLLL